MIPMAEPFAFGLIGLENSRCSPGKASTFLSWLFLIRFKWYAPEMLLFRSSFDAPRNVSMMDKMGSSDRDKANEFITSVGGRGALLLTSRAFSRKSLLAFWLGSSPDDQV